MLLAACEFERDGVLLGILATGISGDGSRNDAPYSDGTHRE
jgi:hypothetical protein